MWFKDKKRNINASEERNWGERKEKLRQEKSEESRWVKREIKLREERNLGKIRDELRQKREVFRLEKR